MTVEALGIPHKTTTEPSPMRWVRRWLWFLAFLVFAMIVIGGMTRLTDSGLSITVWEPLIGVFPPNNAAQWQEAFDRYKQTTEYQIQNKGMTLGEFQYIYWWEWAHRFFGRLIGVVFLLPFLGFLLARKFNTATSVRLLIIFLLGAAQAALGWYMVKSGLVDRVDVSQYRLAAHLTLASFLFASIVWVALGIGRDLQKFFDWHTGFALFIVLLIFLQIVAGGFVAGLDAGHASDTWPKMNGLWVPDGLTTLTPVWKNWLENALAVHFNHRALAYAILLLALLHAWQSFRVSSFIMVYAILVQIAVGTGTVLTKVQIGYAISHQAVAMIVLAAAVWNLHRQMFSGVLRQDPL
jgi:heme a synthase